ncbi:MAG: formylmethanofuran dehydrogenase subunit B [Candidatus Syntropharchaeia archaeon]
MFTCPGCACLCDDIDALIDGNRIEEVENACRKGCAYFLEYKSNRTKGDVDKLIEKASEILKTARNPAIFGLDASPLGAQRSGLELAKKLDAYLDDTSSFCHGVYVEKILLGEMKTCTLDDVRDRADVSVYWGSDPSNSHPRLLSKFSYYPRGKFRQRGWEADRTTICIDIRESPTAKICKKFFRVPHGKDEMLIRGIIDAMDGKVPKWEKARDVIELTNMLKKAEYGVIFSGLGLRYSLDKTEILSELLKKLEYHLIPMVGHYNMRGFNHVLYEETGYINRIKFENGEVKRGYSFIELLKDRKIDAALVIGSDPLSKIPLFVSRYLREIPVITIDPKVTPTTEISDVSIPCAITGIETEGKAIRMDGIEIELKKIVDSDYISDEEILKELSSLI